jgi:hypothetical protein
MNSLESMADEILFVTLQIIFYLPAAHLFEEECASASTVANHKVAL